MLIYTIEYIYRNNIYIVDETLSSIYVLKHNFKNIKGSGIH